MNQELATSFKEFLAAAKNLSEKWQNSEHEGSFSRLYPFEHSFDEMIPLIELWANDAKERLMVNSEEEVLKSIAALEETADADFKLWLHWIKESGILADVIETEFYHSGGGFEHFFLRLKDGRILVLHLQDENGLELSFLNWASIEDYINAGYEEEEKGFGYEYTHPESETRCLTISPENLNNLINLYKTK